MQKTKFVREPIHPECEKDKGCSKIIEENGIKVCSAYIKPSVFWERGGCALASHVIIDSSGPVGKSRIGQQKQKKKTRKK